MGEESLFAGNPNGHEGHPESAQLHPIRMLDAEQFQPQPQC